MIVSVKQILQDTFGLITITSSNDVLAFTSDKGSANIDVPDNTYEIDNLVTALQIAMNANTTLTGTGAITFIITYSSTTGKVTIDAGTGHTIALTYSTSDGALTWGFTANKSAAQTITADQPIPGNPNSIDVVTLHQRAESLVMSALDRHFESASYTWQLDGKGCENLMLPEYPISAVNYIGYKTTGIKIKNTATDASNAYVTIDSTNMTLTVSGGTYAGTTSLALATYTTLTLLIAAVNAYAHGWSAEIYDSDYASYPSTNLIEIKNFYCGSFGGIATSWQYLDILNEPLQGYEIYGDEGEGYIAIPDGWTRGRKNVVVKCTAGYAASDMPADLQGVITNMVIGAYNQKSQNMQGVKQYRIAQYSITYGDSNTIVADGWDMIYSKYHKVRL